MYNPKPRAPTAGSKVVVVPLLVVVVLGLLWTAFWFYAASVAEATIAGWRQREEQLGRSFACGSQSLTGYPFRIELRCSSVSAEWRSATPPFALTTKDFLAVAQVYQPNLLIAEIAGPLTLSEPDAPVALTGEWTLARASLRGAPARPERLSVALDNLKLARGTSREAMFSGRHVEVHARVDPHSSKTEPALDLAARFEQVRLPIPGFSEAIDAQLSTLLRGVEDLEPRPLPVLFRELQAAGGELEILGLRLAYGNMLASGSGRLRLSPQGRLDGEVMLTIAGFDAKLLRAWLPALNDTQQLAGLSLLALFGHPVELEGRPAVRMPLRFSDGVVSLGPLSLGRTAALY